MGFAEEELQSILMRIRKEAGSSQEYRSSIESLLKLYRNIYQSDNDKFTKINLEKAQSKLWSKAPSMEKFMLATGWSLTADSVKFTDKENLQKTINLLASTRTSVSPQAEEWIAATKFEQLRISGDSREQRLRQEAAEARTKEHAACLEDIKKRKDLNELIKREIESDIQHRKRFDQAS